MGKLSISATVLFKCRNARGQICRRLGGLESGDLLTQLVDSRCIATPLRAETGNNARILHASGKQKRNKTPAMPAAIMADVEGDFFEVSPA